MGVGWERGIGSAFLFVACLILAIGVLVGLGVAWLF
jgi:hypothetical protein